MNIDDRDARQPVAATELYCRETVVARRRNVIDMSHWCHRNHSGIASRISCAGPSLDCCVGCPQKIL